MLFLLYKLMMGYILGLTILGLYGMLDGRAASRLAELVKDFDLILLVERMLCLRGSYF